MKRYGFLLLLLIVAPVSPQSGPPITKVELTFSGNERVASNELVENFKTCSKNGWKTFDQKAYTYFAQRCSRQLMFSKGFWQAKVGDISSRTENDTLVAQIQMMEGPRYRLGRIEIKGDEVVAEKEILAMLGQRSGSVADGRAFHETLFDKLKQKYDELGYVQYSAEFDPSFIDPKDWKQDGVVNVTITIDEGRQFKVRRIVFAGVDDAERDSLVGGFLMKSGEVFSDRRLKDAVDKLNELERFMAVDKDRDIEILTNEEEGNIDLVIKLKKGDG